MTEIEFRLRIDSDEQSPTILVALPYADMGDRLPSVRYCLRELFRLSAVIKEPCKKCPDVFLKMSRCFSENVPTFFRKCPDVFSKAKIPVTFHAKSSFLTHPVMGGKATAAPIFSAHPLNAWMKDKGLNCKLPMQSGKAKPDKHIAQAGIQPFIGKWYRKRAEGPARP